MLAVHAALQSGIGRMLYLCLLVAPTRSFCSLLHAGCPQRIAKWVCGSYDRALLPGEGENCFATPSHLCCWCN